LRLSLAPSALADIAAGTLLGAGVWPSGAAPFLLMAGSACVYHGGMALNDWADREADARDRRPRPIPRGEIAPAFALTLAVLLLVAGPLLAWLASPRAAACLGGVALLATLYDLAGRGPWLGPLLLGACRAGNLGAGLLLGAGLAGGAVPHWLPFAPVIYGSYVFSVSRLARLEDRAPSELPQSRPERWLGLSALLLVVHGLIGDWKHGHVDVPMRVAALAVALWGAAGLLRAQPTGRAWTPGDAGRAAGMGLRRLLVGTSALALQSSAPHAYLVAGAILCGYPVSFALRKVFPPT